jgi:hypothetical protein
MAEQPEPQRGTPSTAPTPEATADDRPGQCGSHATCTLRRSLLAPAEVRRFVEQHVCPRHGDLAVAAVALVATELVTHATLRGQGPITVVLECGVTTLKVSVHCLIVGSGETSTLRLGDTISSMIVDSICRGSGVEHSQSGSTMWCTIPTGYLPIPTQRQGDERSPASR